MKSFLLKGKMPIIKWGNLPDNTFFEGKLPEGYSLAICPSKGYVVVDVDVHDDVDGFTHIPMLIQEELQNTLSYKTKNHGRHYWLKYSGNKPLGNKTSGLGIDLRTDRGYVVWYHEEDIRDILSQVNNTSLKMNEWLEKLFSYI